jgi:hypothetical protein
MPHKHNAGRRHHISKMSFKMRNWPAYEAGLRQRGSLTLWIEDAALECWQTIGPGGQARYTNAAIQSSLMLRVAFKLALRQIEGLMTSVLSLMGLTISAPDHTTVGRRAVTLRVIQAPSVPHGPLHILIDSTGLQVYGAGQWLEAKHGAKSRRTWRKLHLAVDAANGMIVAQTLTDQDADDPSQVGRLLDQIDDPASASPWLCSPADRGCHRRGCAESDVGDRTPGFRPSPTGHRIADHGLCRWLRASEVASLKVAHIDSSRMVIRVDQGKGGRDRYVMLSSQLLDILRAYWRLARPPHWLFPRHDGEHPIHPTSLNAACRTAFAAAGLSKRFCQRSRQQV